RTRPDRPHRAGRRRPRRSRRRGGGLPLRRHRRPHAAPRQRRADARRTDLRLPRFARVVRTAGLRHGERALAGVTGAGAAAGAGGVASRQAETRAAARATWAERHPGERERFERLLARAEQYYPIREDNEVWTQSVPLALVRRALLEVGRRLAGAGSVAER